MKKKSKNKSVTFERDRVNFVHVTFIACCNDYISHLSNGPFEGE